MLGNGVAALRLAIVMDSATQINSTNLSLGIEQQKCKQDSDFNLCSWS